MPHALQIMSRKNAFPVFTHFINFERSQRGRPPVEFNTKNVGASSGFFFPHPNENTELTPVTVLVQ